MAKTIQAALLGAGTVGGGVYRLLERRKGEMPDKIGAELVISKVLVRDATKPRAGIPAEKLTERFEDILNDPDISIVIELMGGIDPAKQYIEAALAAGKHVVTANKDLLAEHGFALARTAAERGLDLRFEASVAGGIPILTPLMTCLEGNDITEVMGIVNGTTNFILTGMANEGMDFADALKMAQELGYAEADPTADVEGLDAARKVAILASLAFHSKVTFSDVPVEGITKIRAKDISYAKEMGYVIKLIGIARNTDGEIEVGVSPMMLPKAHPLASVNGSFNAVFVHGDALDDAMFQGRGAGELPTASAVLGDLIAVCRDMLANCSGRIRMNPYKGLPLQARGNAAHRFFLRLKVEDRPGILASVAGVLGNNGVGISQVIQKQRTEEVAEIVVITDRVATRHMEDALAIFRSMSVIRSISSVLRVYSGQ
ncbi:MAG: homoserine dehydrogenase [Oscillospiraceae bacterium]|nr:homoserine dehydrogenase [Oscillospiraceae bacterium]